MFETFLVGILISALMGLATGWVRYWMGFFVLFQGVIASLLIVWLVGKYAKKNAPTANPSVSQGFLFAFIWVATFWAAEICGLGLAQPWFEPLGYFGRILQGDAREMAFGMASTAGWARSFRGGFGGVFWVILNIIDTAIMYFFLIRLPWPNPVPKAKGGSPPPTPGGVMLENPAGGES